MILDLPKEMAIEKLLKYRKLDNSRIPATPKARLQYRAISWGMVTGLKLSLSAMQSFSDSIEDEQWRAIS